MKFDFLAAWIKFNKNVDCRLGIPVQPTILKFSEHNVLCLCRIQQSNLANKFFF